MSWDEIEPRIVWKEPHKSLEAELPTIAEIKYDPHPCEDCGRTISCCRVVEHIVRQTPHLHMKHTCRVCGLAKDPNTGKFTLDTKGYNAFLRTLKRTKDK